MAVRLEYTRRSTIVVDRLVYFWRLLQIGFLITKLLNGA
jgi:hypothetical protein